MRCHKIILPIRLCSKAPLSDLHSHKILLLYAKLCGISFRVYDLSVSCICPIHVYVLLCVCPSMCMSPPCVDPLRLYVPTVYMSAPVLCPCSVPSVPWVNISSVCMSPPCIVGVKGGNWGHYSHFAEWTERMDETLYEARDQY